MAWYDEILVQIISPYNLYLNPKLVVSSTNYGVWSQISSSSGKWVNFCRNFFLNWLKKSTFRFNRKYKYCFECSKICVHCFILSVVCVCRLKYLQWLGFMSILSLLMHITSRVFFLFLISNRTAPCSVMWLLIESIHEQVWISYACVWNGHCIAGDILMSNKYWWYLGPCIVDRGAVPTWHSFMGVCKWIIWRRRSE